MVEGRISSHITEDVDLLIELLLPFLTNANQCGVSAVVLILIKYDNLF